MPRQEKDPSYTPVNNQGEGHNGGWAEKEAEAWDLAVGDPPPLKFRTSPD